MTIDWSKPIEAVHEDGRVVATVLDRSLPQPHNGLYTTFQGQLEKDVDNRWWKPTGEHNYIGSGWHIRNIAKPVLPPELSPEVVERMVALVRTAAKGHGSFACSMEAAEWFKPMSDFVGKVVPEAQAILAEIEPVDEDLVEARAICQAQNTHYPTMYKNAGRNHDATMRAVLTALARGRELEREARRWAC